MRRAWTAAAVGLIAVCGGAVLAQSGAPAGAETASPYGVLASLDLANADSAGVAALTFPMTLPAPEPTTPLAPEMFDPRPMWPAPARAANASPPPIASHEANVQIGAVVTARY